VKLADTAKNLEEVRDKIAGAILKDGSVTAAFERKGKQNVTYSHRQHTKQETKCILMSILVNND
jgi:transcriptional/translational regulatory protein YebC/TACO1